MKSFFETFNDKDYTDAVLKYLEDVIKTIQVRPTGMDFDPCPGMSSEETATMLRRLSIPAYDLTGTTISVAATFVLLNKREKFR